MIDETKKLCKYRIEKARECIKSAEALKLCGDYAFAVNRSYYAIFHSIRAVMALDGEDRKKHSGVIAYFQEHYIKSGVFDKECSYIVQTAFRMWQKSDYEDFYIISKEEVSEQIKNAKKLIAMIEEYVLDII